MRADQARQWDEKYRSGLPAWDRQGVSPALLHWLEVGRLAPCRILVPGCGHGHEVMELARRGFDAYGLDIAPTPLARLRARLAEAGLGARLIQADALVWQPEAPFDAIYEQTCLCALDPGVWPAYQSQLYRWLKPGGALFALFMQTGRTGGPPYHCDLGEMHTLFPDDRWAWAKPPYPEVPHPNGLFEVAVVLRRQP